jgi:hypothetical protein
LKKLVIILFMFLVGCASNSEFNGLKRNVIALGDAQQSQAVATERALSKISVYEAIEKARIADLEKRVFSLEEQVSSFSSKFDSKFRANAMK